MLGFRTVNVLLVVFALFLFLFQYFWRVGALNHQMPVSRATHLVEVSSRASKANRWDAPPQEDPVVIAPSRKAQDLASLLHDLPISPLERELQRIYNLSLDVAMELNRTIWPTDGSLLGMMRNGRIATDLDIDFQFHTQSLDTCYTDLAQLRDAFTKRLPKDNAAPKVLKYFKVAMIKGPHGKKIGRYAMVRLHRVFGTFDTGADFNCVYHDNPNRPTFHTHKGVLIPVPASVYPLARCLLYGQAVRCPADGYAVLATLSPRYDGCMVYPHCMGDHPSVKAKGCLTPHPKVPVSLFPEMTLALEAEGFVSLGEHWRTSHYCRLYREGRGPVCRRGGDDKAQPDVCFLQPFNG